MRSETKRPALRPFLAYLAAERGVAFATIDAYRRDLEDADKFQARNRRKLAACTTDELQSYLTCRTRKGDSSATIARRLASLRAFFSFLGNVAATERLEAPKQEQRLPDTINSLEVDVLIRSIDAETPLGKRDLAIVELMYATGLRATELCTLTVSNVDLKALSIRVMGKGSKERIIPMTQRAAQAITQYMAVRPAQGETLFQSRNGKPLAREDLWAIIYKQGGRAALRKDIHPHTLRHCFASHLLSGGANIRVVQEMLGHSSLETTQIYTHVDTARLKKVHALLGR